MKTILKSSRQLKFKALDFKLLTLAGLFLMMPVLTTGCQAMAKDGTHQHGEKKACCQGKDHQHGDHHEHGQNHDHSQCMKEGKTCPMHEGKGEAGHDHAQCAKEGKTCPMHGQAKPAEEPAAGALGSIAAHGVEAFMLSEKLTKEQKEKLLEIHGRTFRDSTQLRKDLAQAKVELFKTIAKGKYKSSEIDKIKKRIIDIDQKRLQIMFKALEEVEAIIGHGVDAEEIYRRFYDFDRPRHYDVSETNG